MPRLNKTETTERLDYETLLVEITRKPSGAVTVLGLLKDEKTGLADMVLFTDEERMGALVDDLTEALLLISTMKKGKEGE